MMSKASVSGVVPELADEVSILSMSSTATMQLDLISSVAIETSLCLVASAECGGFSVLDIFQSYLRAISLP